MRYNYEHLEDIILEQEEKEWVIHRAWQRHETHKKDKQAVMVHELNASTETHGALLGRYHEEVRRTLFKVSNLPGSALGAICLERAFKRNDPKNNSPSYFIITKGWYKYSLHDFFTPDGQFSDTGADIRKQLRNPQKRSEFWQSIHRIAMVLLRLQQGKMFCPPLTLKSFVFWSTTDFDFQQHEVGQVDFENLRLSGLEKTIPFGQFGGNFFSPYQTKANPPTKDIIGWRSLAEVVVDVLFGPPHKPKDKKNPLSYRKEMLKKGMHDGFIQIGEVNLLEKMLSARDSFCMGNVCEQIKNYCYMPSKDRIHVDKRINLRVVYTPDATFQNFGTHTDDGYEPPEQNINNNISKRLESAEVFFDPETITVNKKFSLYFDCGNGLYFRGNTYFRKCGKDGYEYDSRLLHISFANYINPSPHFVRVSLSGTNITCRNLYKFKEEERYITGPRDWALELNTRTGLKSQKIMQEAQLKVLSSLELANQLESLMAFLTMYLCRIDNISTTDDEVTIYLAPYRADMLDSYGEKDKALISKISEIQCGTRDYMDQKGDYSEHLKRYLIDQIEYSKHGLHGKSKQTGILLTPLHTAGSLSINPRQHTSINSTLDDITWDVQLDSLTDKNKTLIQINRKKKLTRKEKDYLKETNMVSVRTRGHYGQMEVIKRRTDAFEHLKKYEMLMQQLVDPTRKSAAYIDCDDFQTMAKEKLYNGAPEPKKELDENKMAIIEDAYRMAPLFALQGPPGTGKSETVCALTKLIFSEDPMVQILLTSRENVTVKELLRKLYVESQDWIDTPIFKLSAKIQDSMASEDSLTKEKPQFNISMDGQVHRILNDAKQRCKANKHVPYNKKTMEVLQKWHAYLNVVNPNLSENEDIRFLIEQSANLIFTTASDKGLADMVASGYMYDWAFVEEAGKTPFYDLILPMLVSQRWVLLGDPKQLKPFQAAEFANLMDNYRQIVDMLKEVKNLDRGRKDYVSLKNIERVLAREGQEHSRFFDREWIEPFKKIFTTIAEDVKTDRTTATSDTAAVLNIVYRMPPVLTKLVDTYYADIDLHPAPMACNEDNSLAPSLQKSNPLAWPPSMETCNGIWVNTDYHDDFIEKEQNKQHWNSGEASLIADIISLMEVNHEISPRPSLAILTPYRRQVKEIRKSLAEHDNKLKEHFTPVVMNNQNGSDWVSTIDSFQGCQAEIVILSLVRNQPAAQKLNYEPIRFVADNNRVNVMVSRAQRVLIIVGNLKYYKSCCKDQDNDEIRFFKEYISNFEQMASEHHSAEFLKIITAAEVISTKKIGIL
ncbi:AAA domain-containing protein [Maridesulfovibrio sp.]|uniref:AAA domain-containing protein n=1 Tax=unclassified Maridesulfovibrio TaxID=2794999 RepID=UPI003AFFA601